ncbi:tRNA (guanine(9)-N(1))-methyltransferase [Puccinia graminis f. sp. tritici]|uniref:tRNA (guanine(9)-N1)-methyltransferase n=1 Tax=Puccinia graminis f. sp. tritici TaxID=56615 RepID=A0A5B0PHW3_PUCGR|nr:tRNA (guanine(9)-N(1))-methyltransferase [Puccinia graminis f. sp. tritici]
MNSPTSSSQEIEEPLKGTSTTRIKQEEDNNSNQLSKKQLKRQLKRQLILDERPAKRAAERARKKAKKLESKNSTTPKQQEDGGNSNKQKPIIFPATVVFDCRFDDKMSDKNLCLDLATNQAFQHAQLPIAEHFSQLKTRKVLTVNQVFEILVNYLVDQDWKNAFERVIPSRKL